MVYLVNIILIELFLNNSQCQWKPMRICQAFGQVPGRMAPGLAPLDLPLICTSLPSSLWFWLLVVTCDALDVKDAIVWLVQAKALAKDATDGGSLRESASNLPLVLMSEKSSSRDDVWRGIELGAADVLEKPLSSLKLRNIWQHVVRKVRPYCRARNL